MMKRGIMLLTLALLLPVSLLFAQGRKAMSPPTIMIVPGERYCKAHGYTLQFSDQGRVKTIPDYETAITSDQMLNPVLTQVADMINERNGAFEIVDISTAINNGSATEALIMSNSGDVSESVDEAIIRSSNCDILIKVDFDIIKNGPYSSMQITMIGTDSYTGFQIAPVEGVGQPSSSAPASVLLREAVHLKMDAFLDKLLNYYSRMSTSGRAAAFEFKICEGSSLNMNKKVGEYTLREEIDNLLYDNSVDGVGLEKVQGGNTFLSYRSVYIPLMGMVAGRERKQGAYAVAQRICNSLSSKFNIEAECKAVGLGRVYVFIK